MVSLKRPPSAAAEQFERLQPAIQPDIVAAIFDNVAGVRHGGAVAVENPAYRFKTQFETDMGQIHRDLSGKGCAWRAPRRREQRGHLQSKIARHAERDPLAGPFRRERRGGG